MDALSRARNAPNAARIGLNWGAIFALPWFAFAVLALASERLPYGVYLAEAVLLCGTPATLTLAGVWWSRRTVIQRNWRRLVLAAVTLGFVLILMLAVAAAIDDWRIDKPIRDSFSADILLLLWIVASSWALALYGVISLHVRRTRLADVVPLGIGSAESTAQIVQTDRADNSIKKRGFAFALIAAIASPLLLGAPILLLLNYDTRVRTNADAVLSEEIAKTEGLISDIKDLENVKARLLARKQILQVLEPSAAQAADVLSVFGRMPEGVQLQLLELKGRHVSFVSNSTSASNERSFVELLERSGFRDVRITRPKSQEDNDMMVATVEATSTRMDAK